MRRFARLAFAVLLAATGAALPAADAQAQAPAPGDLVINEIMYDPPQSPETNYEWVEIYNRSGRTIDLNDVQFGDAAALVEITNTATPLVDGAYAVLVRDAATFNATFPGVSTVIQVAGFPTLNNSGGDRPRLVAGTVEVDAVPYQPSWGGAGKSLERKDPAGPSTAASNFGSTTDPSGGTPGRQNSLFAVDTSAPTLSGAEAVNATTVDVTFSEPVTAASAQQASNYAVSGIGTPTSAVLQGDGTVVRLTLPAPLTGPASYTLTVTGVADAAGNAIASAQTTFFFGQFDAPNPRDIVVNEVMYDPPPSQPSANEWVELFNRTTDRTFDLSALRFTDAGGTPVTITTTATAFPPGAYVVIGRDAAAFAAAYPGVPFVQVAGFPTLNNDADTPTVLRADGTVIDAVPYRASWGGTDASLERKDPNGPSTSARNFATSTDPARATPGRRNSVYAPDTSGPTLVSATASPDGRTVTVTVDEPLDLASVTAGAFTVSGATVTAATYDDATQTVTLTLAAPLAASTSTVTAMGLRDGLGNTTATATTTVAFTPDVTPPGIAQAFPTSATTVRVEFTEPVTVASAQNPASYSIDGGIGTPTGVAVETEDGAAIAVVLTFATALTERQVYTLTASGLADLAGNTQTGTSTAILLGETDLPGAGELVVTEVMYDPQTGQSEYFEVLNTTADRIFGLRTVTLDDGDPTSAVAISRTPSLVLPGMYAVVVRNGPAFAAQFPGVPFVVLSNLSLSNSGEAIVLRSGGAVVDSVFYQPSWHRAELDDATGISLERRDPAGPSNAASNWSSSLDPSGGTPGRSNTLSIATPAVPRGDAITVTSPFAPDDGEAARITYTLDASAALVRVRIFDGAGRMVREIEDGRLSGQTGTVEWDGTGDDHRRLRAGIYILLLEAVDTGGGTTEAHRAAIVLARR